MVLGIGIDAATIFDFEQRWPEGAWNLALDALDPFVSHSFTPAEVEVARARGRRGAEFLAGRFAVKEAVFKALGPLTDGGFDLRMVECLPDETGAPRVTTSGPLAAVLAQAGASRVLVSISNEAGCAIAIALVE